MPWSFSINGEIKGDSCSGSLVTSVRRFPSPKKSKSAGPAIDPPEPPTDTLRDVFGVDIGYVHWKTLVAAPEPENVEPDPPRVAPKPNRYRPEPEEPTLPWIPPRHRRTIKKVGTHGFMRVHCIGCDEPIRIPAPNRVSVSEVVREYSWCRKCLGVAGREVLGMVKSDRRAWRVGDYPSERQYHGGMFYSAEW